MSYDLIVWPVDRAMTTEEAIEEAHRRSTTWKLGLRRNRKIDAFAKQMRERFPGIDNGTADYPMEFDVGADHVHLALPWTAVAEVIEVIGPLAFDAGLAVCDPQREIVALPPPYGTAPLGTEGVEEHERGAADAIQQIVSGLGSGDPGYTLIPAGTFTVSSPLGFEITPDIQADVMANPLRVPTSLQTAGRKASLLEQLRAERAMDQHEAALMLSGWDPDPDVRAALLGALDTDDAALAGILASAIARQGNVADLPALTDLVRRMSPADGGTTESMWMPITGAFQLARLAGADAVDDLKAKAREFYAAGPSKRRSPKSDAEFELWLDLTAVRASS